MEHYTLRKHCLLLTNYDSDNEIRNAAKRCDKVQSQDLSYVTMLLSELAIFIMEILSI